MDDASQINKSKWIKWECRRLMRWRWLIAGDSNLIFIVVCHLYIMSQPLRHQNAQVRRGDTIEFLKFSHDNAWTKKKNWHRSVRVCVCVRERERQRQTNNMVGPTEIGKISSRNKFNDGN